MVKLLSLRFKTPWIFREHCDIEMPTSACLFGLMIFHYLVAIEAKIESPQEIGIGKGKSTNDYIYECINGSLVEDECQCLDMITLCKKQPCLTKNESIQRRYMCDGIFHCSDLSDECLCDRKTIENLHTYEICENIFSNSKDSCPVGYFNCESLYNMTNSISENCTNIKEVCDGIEHCDNGIDEVFCKNYNVPNNLTTQTFGQSQYSVHNNKTYYFYCENATKNYPDSLADVSFDDEYAKSYQEGKWLYIDWRRRFDGVPDCNDVSDEWHPNFVYCGDGITDQKITRCPETPEGDRFFSTPESMVDTVFFPIFEWTVGSIALIGNTIVATHSAICISRRRKRRRRSEEDNVSSNATISQLAGYGKVSNHILVLFLCGSDLLMAIQIIFMASANEIFRGEFWRRDDDWLSGSCCAIIGVFAVFTTQASAFMIVVIALVRLYVVSRPFKTLKLKYVVLASMTAYALAVIFALIPLMTFIKPVENYFIQSASVPNHPQVDATVIEMDKAEEYVKKISILYSPEKARDSYSALQWSELEATVHKINPEYANWVYFGFYSHVSICTPIVVAHWSDPGLIYSFSVLVLDFTSFVLVFVAYAVVYKKTRRKGNGCLMDVGCCEIIKRSRSSVSIGPPGNQEIRPRSQSFSRDDEDQEMQKRILWIIGTDFACWCPVCILTLASVLSPSVKGANSMLVSIFLIQINCMVNPLVYSRRIRFRLKSAFQACARALRKFVIKLCKKDKDVGDENTSVREYDHYLQTQSEFLSYDCALDQEVSTVDICLGNLGSRSSSETSQNGNISTIT